MSSADRQTDRRTDARPKSDSQEERQYFVSSDLRSIPLMELPPICGGFAGWIGAVLHHKLLRREVQPDFAFELSRFKPLEARLVPKRIKKRFDELESQLKLLGFLPNFYAASAAIGPVVSATMVMSRQEGQIHFLVSQQVLREAGKVVDRWYFRFISCLPQHKQIVTGSRSGQAFPRAAVQLLELNSQDPEHVLKRHRDRIRTLNIKNVLPGDFFEHLEADTKAQAADWTKRRVIRRATSKEVARIRSLSKL